MTRISVTTNANIMRVGVDAVIVPVWGGNNPHNNIQRQIIAAIGSGHHQRYFQNTVTPDSTDYIVRSPRRASDATPDVVFAADTHTKNLQDFVEWLLDKVVKIYPDVQSVALPPLGDKPSRMGQSRAKKHENAAEVVAGIIAHGEKHPSLERVTIVTETIETADTYRFWLPELSFNGALEL